MGDHRYEARDRAGQRGHFDERRLKLAVELGEDDTLVEFPARCEVCSTCGGRGSHVNPDVDGHGITADEFAEDPGFQEQYSRGTYDVPCYGCGGRRVVPVIDRDAAAAEGLGAYLQAYDQQQEELAECYAQQLAERRAGC